MKRFLFTLFLLVVTLITANAQPQSIHYKKENDFFMNVIYNPTFSIYEFLVVGLSSKNTELKALNRYVNSTIVQDKCRELNVSMEILTVHGYQFNPHLEYPTFLLWQWI